jgi:hypothetical protein
MLRDIRKLKPEGVDWTKRAAPPNIRGKKSRQG